MQKTYQLPDPFWPLESLRDKDWYSFGKEIQELRGGRVVVQGHGEMVMLSSYSYLGLLGHQRIDSAANAAVEAFGTGAHGARLVAGTCPIHTELENALAELKSTDDAILFSSGYAANVGTISALAGPNDYVFCDKTNHASIVDGCLLSRARFKRFKHNSPDHLRALLARVSPGRNKLVVVDAVFSMDGDIANLPEIARVCEEYDALLMVDEAHSFGVIGESGQGIEEHFGLSPDSIDLKMGTLSKAIPSTGGYLASTSRIIELLRNRARNYVFSAPLPPVCAAAAFESLAVIEDEPWRVRRLHENVKYFIDGMRANDLNTLNTETAIVPVIIGDEERGYQVARRCRDDGVFVHLMTHPVVPKGTERLRCSVTTDNSRDDLDSCISAITAAVRAFA